jgi:pilus assembly protein Flp/PilA
MRREFMRFIANDQGAAALEYGLIAAGIALAFLAAFIPFGGELRTIADTVTAGLAEIVALSSR